MRFSWDPSSHNVEDQLSLKTKTRWTGWLPRAFTVRLRFEIEDNGNCSECKWEKASEVWKWVVSTNQLNILSCRWWKVWYSKKEPKEWAENCCIACKHGLSEQRVVALMISAVSLSKKTQKQEMEVLGDTQTTETYHDIGGWFLSITIH